MSAMTEEQVKEVLRGVSYPGYSRNIVSFGLVRGIEIEGGEIKIHLVLSTQNADIPQALKDSVERALADQPGVERVTVHIEIKEPTSKQVSQSQPQTTGIPGIKQIIAVASGKGGVGKSTVAANLAMAFQSQGFRTGLCDCDLYGPSVGLMFGVEDRPYVNSEQKIIPLQRYGLTLMSMAFLLSENSPVILRGPMVTRYTQQFLRQVEWGELDVLVLDLPPGTGDIQLTIVQTVELKGAVIVTTPQEVALIDARKAAAMFGRVNVPVLGIIENMSYFLCPSDGVAYPIFGEGGGEREAERLGVPLLGKIPIEMETREAADTGWPIVGRNPETKSAKEFLLIAKTLAESK